MTVARERVQAMESLAAVIAHELRAGVLGVYATELPPRLFPGDPDALWRGATRAVRGALEAKTVAVTQLGLAQRAAVAHGGEITDHRGDDDSLLVTIRLPISKHPE